MLAIGLGLSSLASSIEGRHELNPWERVVLLVSSPVLRATRWAEGHARAVMGRYRRLTDLEEENRILRVTIEGLKTERLRSVEESAANKRLRALLGFKERAGLPSVAAEVIGEDLGAESRTLLIDKGRHDGIHRNAAVVTEAGVVGKVSELGDVTSRVLLLVDHRSAVDGLVQRTRAKTVVRGSGLPQASLDYLERREDVRAGDLVVTSGYGGIFPKGLRIGTVEHVEAAPFGLFQRAELKPAVEFGRLEEVLVLTSLDREELDSSKTDGASRGEPARPEASKP
ncbi:MAG: rod shape-determining protein MreC [Deltaproteobacteria bacterium]|nr:rod shape-determining protein MreC [Deltaproteobacteria bacterium]